ncbi:MAG: hypothetical protein K8S87_12850 [Planctomycetes bacterium]|nr:hypothetical protein [Planctomycetota bacterium]
MTAIKSFIVRKRCWLLASMFILLLSFISLNLILASEDSQDLFAKAEKFFNEKSFAKALSNYTEALKNSGAEFTKRQLTRFRIAQCQHQLKKYNEMLKTYEELIKDYPSTTLTVDVLTEFADNLIRLPHYYYKKDDKISWGKWISGGNYHYVRESNIKKAEKNILAAKELQIRLLLDSTAELFADTRWHWRERLADIHLKEASIYEVYENYQRNQWDYTWENRSFWERTNPEDPDGPKEISQSRKIPEGEGWQKIENRTFRVYKQADAIIEAYKQANIRYSALYNDYKKILDAEYAKGEENKETIEITENRVTGYLERAGEALYRTASYLARGTDATPEYLRLVYGEKNWNKYNILPKCDEFAEAYPKHFRAPEILMLKANQQKSNQDFIGAVKTLDVLMKSYVESPWAKTAKTSKQEILRPRLKVNASLNGIPGQEVTLSARIRNINNLKIELYKFDIARYIEKSHYLTAYNMRLNSVSTLLDKITDKDEYDYRYSQSMVKELEGFKEYLTFISAREHKTKDISRHRYHNEAIASGLKDKGFYLVRISGENMFGANFVQISTKTLVSRAFSDRRQYYLADRESGSPIMGKNELVIKEYRWKPHTNYVKIFRSKLHAEEGNGWHKYRELPPRHSIQNLTAIAKCEDGEVIMHTNQYGQYWWSMAFRDSEIKGFTVTDRPIYRPKQTIQFSSILRARKKGSYGFAPPKKGGAVWLTMWDSKGTKLIDQRYELDEFGQIHGQYTLGEEPALGSYSIYMRWQGGGYSYFNASSHYFRVEEYRKPEFAVSVSSEQNRMKVGSLVKAKIAGKYYFGAPVANGEVKYKVFRKEYVHKYRFPGAFDWLYSYVGMWHHRLSDHYTRYAGWQRELVTEGTGRLDENGNFEISFNAGPEILARGPDDPAVKQLLTNDPDLKRFFEKDYAYEITADVTDSARRLISGRGSIKVTRQSFSMFSNYRNNFYRPKSKVEIELRSLTPSGKAISVDGSLHIEEVKRYYSANEHGQREIKEEVVRSVVKLPFKTDARGIIFLRQVFDKEGLYKLTFTADDPEGGIVTHVNKILIASEDSTGTGLRFDTLEIVPEKRFYAESETISCVILTSDPGMTAHVMLEPGDGGVMVDRYEMRRLKGTTSVVTFEASKDFVPNVFLTVTSVKNNRVHAANVEVFVPPVKEFLNVTMTPNKTTYSPGEEGTMQIVALDSEEKPVEAQFILSVADESVFAIQADTITDIRKHFYGRRRYLTFRVEHSQNQYFYGAVQDTNKHGSRFWWGSPETPRNYTNGWFDRDHLTAKELEAIRTGKTTIDLSKSELRDESKEKSEGKLRQNLEKGDSDSDDEYFRGDLGRPSPSKDAAPESTSKPSINSLKTGKIAGKKLNKSQLGFKDDITTEEKSLKEGEFAEAAERKDFKDTAFFSSTVKTDKNGKASVKFKYPDNLTTWRFTIRGATKDSRVGEAKTTTLVTKNIIIRLATPRFFMERDELLITTIVHNKFETAQEVKVELNLPTFLSDSEDLPATKEDRYKQSKTITVPAKGESRLDWPVKVHSDGVVKITAAAYSKLESDMMTMTFDAYRHGIEKFSTVAGAIAGVDEVREVSIELPDDFDPDKTWMRVGMNTTVATACLDAVPYLIRYPYGCIEQTMSRFMPAVVVKGTLSDLGISLEDVRKRRELVETDKWDRGSINTFIYNPVFDDGVLNGVIQSGLARIQSWQNGDGGWGWFKGFSSDPYMTAYVVHGLTLANQNGIEFDASMLKRALSFLGKHFLVERSIHRAAFMAYALAPYSESTEFGERAQYKRYLDVLMEKRENFNHLSRSYFALALHHSGRTKDATLLIENIEDYAKTDTQAGTAFWKTSSDGWWYWWNNALETNTAVLRALAAIKPEHKLIEPLSRWVLNHRQGNKWESTKGTSFAILSLMEYAKARGELDAEYDLQVYYGDKLVEKLQVTKDNILSVKPSFFIYGMDVEEGKGKFRIVKQGKGTFAYTLTLKTYDMSCPIKKAGYEIFIERKYYKLIEKIVNPDATDGSRRVTWEKTEIVDLGEVESGDLIEVVLEIDSKNDYEYVMFNDMKPAGCEAVSKHSGYTWADGLGVFMEFRDEKVSMFASWVPQGKHTLKYRLRAETPGLFHALPTVSEAMYAPLVRANTNEMRLNIKDKPE